MSQVELLETTQSLKSNSKRERMVSLEKLANLIRQSNVQNILHCNSGNGSISWNVLFIRVHNAILVDLDKAHSKDKNISVKHLQTMENIIFNISQKSVHEGVPLLECDTIACSILSAFESEFRIRFLGSIYTNLLIKYVLAHRKLWGEIKLEHWIALKNICKASFIQPPPKVQNVVYLDALSDIVRYSCKNVLIAQDLIDLLSFVKSILSSYKSLCNTSATSLLRLINILCLQLAVEFRYVVCSFMEDIFDFVINFCERKKASRNPLIFHFLIIYINVHNPNGVSEMDESFYAFDESKWRQQVMTVFSMAQETVKMLPKNSKKTDFEPGFLDLFVEIHYLAFVCGFNRISNFCSDGDSEDYSDNRTPSNKRKRSLDSSQLGGILTGGRNKLAKQESNFFCVIEDLQPPNAWFWLNFIELFLQKHPQMLMPQFNILIEALSKLLLDCWDSAKARAICRCLDIILTRKKDCKTPNSESEDQLNEIWNKVGLELIRLFELEESIEYHKLMRSLIISSKFRNPGLLLNLYSREKQERNNEDLLTLLTVCQNCLLSDSMPGFEFSYEKARGGVRLFLLQWLFEERILYPTKELSKLLITLIVTRSEEDTLVSLPKNSETVVTSRNIDDLCKSISNVYESVSLKNLNLVERSELNETPAVPKIDVNMLSELFRCLESRHTELYKELLNDSLTFDEKMKTVKDALHHSELLCNLYTFVKNFNVGSRNWDELLEKIKTLLFLTTSKSYELLKIKFFSLAPFVSLYGSNYHEEITTLIRRIDFTCSSFLQHLFDLFKGRSNEIFQDFNPKRDELSAESDIILQINIAFSNITNNSRSILQLKNLSSEEMRMVEAVEVICHFIIHSGSFEQNKYQKILQAELLEELIKSASLNLNSNFCLQIVIRVIYNFSQFKGIDGDTLGKFLQLLKLIYDSKQTDSEITMVILQIMKEFISSIRKTNDESCESTFMQLIYGFKTVMEKNKKYGIKIVRKYVELLIEITRVTWSDRSIFSMKNSKSYNFYSEIILYLKHSYYELRLLVARNVGKLLIAAEKNVSAVFSRNLMTLVEEALLDGSDVAEENRITLLISSYYKIMGFSVSLISWASITCLSSSWRRLSLLQLLQLACSTHFYKSKVTRVLTVICNELGIENHQQFILSNLPYLVQKWAEAGFEFEEFPFYTIGFETIEGFLQNYSKFILPIYIYSGKFDVASKIAIKLNKSEKDVVKSCFPELMAIALPYISENGGNTQTETSRKANNVKYFIENELESDVYDLFSKNMDKIIFRTFYFMEDRNYLNGLVGNQGNLIEDCGLIRITVRQIEDGLENLIPGDIRSLLGVIAVYRPCIIQKVLMHLTGEVERVPFSDNKVLSLHRYIAFVEILSRITKTGSFQNIVTFIVRDVIHTIVSCIRSGSNQTITEMALKCLNRVLRNYIHKFSSLLGDFLSVIAALCKPLAQKGYEEASDILKFLICDHFDKLSSAVAHMDSFPNEKVFEDINCKLEGNKSQWMNIEGTMKHFLAVSGMKRCTVEGVKHLRNVLTNRKNELKFMYEDLKRLKGFSEDCSKSLLHQTICALIELTRAQDCSVRIEAAKCLGELGPLDLTTLILKPGNHNARGKKYKSSLMKLLKSCVKDLSDLIIHENFEIKTAASELLYIIMATRKGNEILREEDQKIRSYLVPFSSEEEKALTIKINSVEFGKNIDKTNLWVPGDSHEGWVRNLVVELLKSFQDDCGFLQGMLKMVEVDWNFAERMFPVILDLILSFADPKEIHIINRNIGVFFKTCFNHSQDSGYMLNLRSLQCMVNVVDYIRIQRNFEGIYDALFLELNYLHVAETARRCSAFFTSILYVELWFNEKKQLKDGLSIDNICELYPEEGFTLTKILRDCYSKIGITDGVHGCGYMHLLDFATESQHYEHWNKWNISMLYHDVELSQGWSKSQTQLLNSLYQFGMIYSVNNLIQKSSNNEELSDIQYKCAASLSDWNLLDNNTSIESYDKGRYFALKAFHNDDKLSFRNEIYKAREFIITNLSSCNLESVENLYRFLSELRCLKELEDFQAALSTREELESLYKRWCQQDHIKYSNFKLMEDILTQRVIITTEGSKKITDPDIKGFLQVMLCEMYYKLLKTARKEKCYETAIRTLSCLSRLNLPDSIIGKMKIEKSLLEWEIGDKNVGKFLLRHFLQQGDLKGDLKAKALRIYGDWMASNNLENSRNILEQYYHKSIEISNGGKDRINSYASLAKYADSNYAHMKEYLKSPLFEMKKKLINRQQDLASGLRQEMYWNEDRDKRIAFRLVEKQSIIDEKEIKSIESEKEFFLGLSVKFYLLSMKEGDRYDFNAFRLISLWFSNPENETVLSLLKEHLPSIPTYKFLCLLPQIVPRMDEIGLISSLVERCLKDHPYHTLPVLFAVANSFEDAKYGTNRPVTQSQRSLTARAMLEKFQKDRRLRRLITEIGHFCDAMIELANTTPADGKSAKPGSVVNIPSTMKISGLKNLQSVPVPSLTIAFNKTCNYNNVIGIKCFESRYQLVGGINVPKKINCTGLDGISRPLLIKGKDDLRQDAVMQQVFTVINSLLHRNPETNRRKLVIRTYKVVPLSHRSGIIEWCDNTQPLSLYLIGHDGKSGAHGKFNPGDLTCLECRSLLRQIVDGTNDQKLEVFLDICKKFHPAFRHFFFENFPEPGVWFERKLAYTHSVATSSMIGYVLGIGDRHVHNILIDNATAEVIHIDLGIAFEQGKTLPTPETVPFRLTRDIVDGMGVSGVEGVFRLSCIKTMEVLRDNYHTILTLLEVLLYDPLYAWTITAERALSVQGHSGNDSSSEKNSNQIEINKMAERALIRLKQKLQGMENGGVSTNVEGQVNCLIQQAMDPNNLCKLFHGWQAYL